MQFKALRQLAGVPAPQHSEFLPAALEIIETPASPAGRLLMGSIGTFMLLALLWACLGSVDIIATASGKIVPTERTKTIQPFETGVVRKIYVRDGQRVKAGEILIAIDSTINEADRARLESDWLRARLDAARLRAAVDSGGDPLAAFAPPQEAEPELVARHRQMLLNQLEERRAKLSGIDQQIARSQNNLSAVELTIGKIKETLPLLRQRDSLRQELAEKGYGSRLDALNTRQQLVESEEELKVQQARRAEAASTLAAYREQRKESEAEYRRGLLRELAEAEQKAASLQEQFLQASQRAKLQTLTAPVDGTVQQLAVHTEGGVVTPAQALLVIVPAGSRLEIEAMVSNRDIGFVAPGQDVAVKVDTFNFTKYGLLHGKLMSLSQDAITRPDAPKSAQPDTGEKTQDQAYVYAARIALNETAMTIDGKTVSLAPGMAVTAEIKTGQRRIIEYLLSPLARHQQESMRER